MRASAPSRRAGIVPRISRRHRSRCHRGCCASARSLSPGSARQALSRLRQELARVSATSRGGCAATRAPASPMMRSAPRAATTRYRASLLDHEFRRVYLTSALDVHHDRAATSVIIESARSRIGIGDRYTIDLKNHVARLNSELVGDPRAHALHQSAVRATNASLRPNGWGERHELDLAQHRYLRSVDFGKIGNANLDAHLVAVPPNNQWNVFAYPKLEPLRFKVVRRANSPVTRPDENIPGANAGAICGRPRNNRAHNDPMVIITCGKPVRRRLQLDPDPGSPHHSMSEKIVRDPSRAIDRDCEAKAD